MAKTKTSRMMEERINMCNGWRGMKVKTVWNRARISILRNVVRFFPLSPKQSNSNIIHRFTIHRSSHSFQQGSLGSATCFPLTWSLVGWPSPSFAFQGEIYTLKYSRYFETTISESLEGLSFQCILTPLCFHGPAGGYLKSSGSFCLDKATYVSDHRIRHDL